MTDTDIQNKLHREMNAAKAIKDGLQSITDDEDAIRDTLEGETNLHELIGSVLESIDDDQIIVDGCAARIADLQSRKARVVARIDAKKAMIEQALIIAELKSIETVVATASLRRVPPSVVISEESDIPAEYWKPQEPKLDKKALKAALDEKTIVPGCSLSNGGVTLSLRRK